MYVCMYVYVYAYMYIYIYYKLFIKERQLKKLLLCLNPIAALAKECVNKSYEMTLNEAMYVCMYVWMYVYMYVCTYVCMHTYITHPYIHTCIQNMNTNTCIYIQIINFKHIYIFSLTHINTVQILLVYKYGKLDLYIHSHTYTYTLTYTYTYMHTN